MFDSFKVRTNNKVEFLDITSQIKQKVNNSEINNGILVINVPHTTAAVTINENADPSVKEDIISEINKIIPFQDNYKHREGNSAAHIKSSMFGSSETIIIEKGKLALGTWQGIYFCEFDGPRSRNVNIKIIKE